MSNKTLQTNRKQKQMFFVYNICGISALRPGAGGFKRHTGHLFLLATDKTYFCMSRAHRMSLSHFISIYILCQRINKRYEDVLRFRSASFRVEIIPVERQQLPAPPPLPCLPVSSSGSVSAVGL